MSYDCLVAICYSLQYPVTMNPCLCGLLVLVLFSISPLDSQLHCLIVSQVTFCPVTEISNFNCDPPQLLKIACDYISTNNILIYLMVQSLVVFQSQDSLFLYNNNFLYSESPIIMWEIQSFLYLWFSLVSCMCDLWNSLWSILQFTCLTC
jgi:hypothetical protein